MSHIKSLVNASKAGGSASAAAANTTAANNTTLNRTSNSGSGKHNQRIMLEPSKQHEEELRQAFDLFDTEGTGRIQAPEVKIALRALGFEVKKEELRALLAEVGSTPQGTIDFSEFKKVLLLKIGEKESKEEVQRAMRHFDEGDKGYISFEDLKSVSEMLGQGLTDDELKEMMIFAAARPGPRDQFFGAKDIPNITEEDFMRLMKKANVY